MGRVLPRKVGHRGEAGLEPLAQALLKDPTLSPEMTAVAYVNAERGVADTDAALEGARQILMEQFSEDADLAGRLRPYFWENASIRSSVIEGKQDEGAKFADYFSREEPVKGIPSHRALALFRGRREGILRVDFRVDPAGEVGPKQLFCESMIAKCFGIRAAGRAGDEWMLATVRAAWKLKMLPRIETDTESRLWEAAEEEANLADDEARGSSAAPGTRDFETKERRAADRHGCGIREDEAWRVTSAGDPSPVMHYAPPGLLLFVTSPNLRHDVWPHRAA